MQDLSITVVEGNYGKVVPIILNSTEPLSNADKFIIKIYKECKQPPLITKEYSNLTDNTIEFKLTLEESLKLSSGIYYYDLDWYQDESFLDTLVAHEIFEVKHKAGKVGTNGDTN